MRRLPASSQGSQGSPPQLVPIQSNYQKMYTSDAENKLKAFKIFTQSSIIKQKIRVLGNITFSFWIAEICAGCSVLL